MLELNRKKRKIFTLSLIYKISKILPFPKKIKFIIFSNLSWIFNRLAFETSNDMVKRNHLSKTKSVNFFKKYLNKNDKIIDIGCGAGEKSFMLSKYCNYILGIDNSSVLIRNAKENYKEVKNLKFLNLDLHDLKSSTEVKYYDVIFLSHILEHVENSNNFIKSLIEFGDKIFIEVPDFDSNILNLFRKDYSIAINYTDDDHVYEFDKKSIIKILNQNDFQIIDIENTHGVIRVIAKKK